MSTTQEVHGTAQSLEGEIARLIKVIFEAERELQQLTGGDLDAVSGGGGKPYLLREAQERLLASEQAQRKAAEMQAAILNAMPPHIALLDSEGVILAVNDAWREYARANGFRGSNFGVGENYLRICENSGGPDAPDLKPAEVGIREVLERKRPEYSIEYSCHSPTEKRWFRLVATPVDPKRRKGAVVMHFDITDQRRAEGRMRRLMDSDAQGVFIWNKAGEILHCNDAFLDITGYTREDLEGGRIKWTALTPPEYLCRDQFALKEIAVTGVCTPYEKEFVRKDGTRTPILIGAATFEDNPSEGVSFVLDLTRSRQREVDLSKTNRALQMLSACNEKLIRARHEQELLDEICRITVEIGGYHMAWVGYALDDERKSVKPMAHAGVEEGYLSELNLTWDEESPNGKGPGGIAIRTGQPSACSDIAKDAVSEPWQMAALERGYRSFIFLPLRNGGKTFGGLGLYSTEPQKFGPEETKLLQEMADDLAFGLEHIRTSRHAQEQAALLDAASDAIVLKDMEDRIVYWNRSAEQLYGWTAAEVLGRKSRDLFFADPSKFDEAYLQLMKNGDWGGEMLKLTKSGEIVTTAARWTLVKDDNGEPKSVLSMSTDITERKKFETHLLRAQRMESIGTLAGGIAHDLNNTLAPIMMSVDILRQITTDKVGLELLSTVETSAQHGADLVRQVLSFGRGVEGRKMLINSKHLLKDIEKVMRDTFPKNIDFRVTAERDVWTLTGDATQLHQVFTNLCVNARDAMPHGGSLRVTVENVVLDEVYAGMNPESKPGAYVLVKVTDTGMGIAPEVRERIFEPFFTTKEVGKGTGLGLSTTLAIIKSHDGFIDLQSELGKGTSFKVYLPANPASKAADEAKKPSAKIYRGNGELVLVVDDEKPIHEIARRTLERCGYRVVLAANGAEAVALYAQKREEIAVVITDMAMPVMDGPSTIIALRAMNPKIKVIGSSGMGSGGGKAKAAAAGARHFISKPYTADEMLKTLGEVLNEGEPAGAPR